MVIFNYMNIINERNKNLSDQNEFAIFLTEVEIYNLKFEK